MNKDPAILFYTSDFLTGTMFMTDEQVGKYIRLLCAQHQKGRLSKQDMINICKTYDKDIFDKFKLDKDGNHYNIRLENESIRRKKYSESRRKNRKGKKKITYVKHMETENETETINRTYKHLILYNSEFEKLKEYYSKDEINTILDNIENYKKNGNYISFYKTALNWLKKEYPNRKNKINVPYI